MAQATTMAKEYLHIRMDPRMKERLRSISQTRGITASEMMRRLVINYLEQVTYFNKNGIDLLKGN